MNGNSAGRESACAPLLCLNRACSGEFVLFRSLYLGQGIVKTPYWFKIFFNLNKKTGQKIFFNFFSKLVPVCRVCSTVKTRQSLLQALKGKVPSLFKL